MGLLNPHLDDGALAELWTGRLTQDDTAAARSARSHLHACAECRARFDAFTTWLDDVRADALAEAEAALSPERLAAQQAQIARRLEAMDAPARVIAFPKFARPIAAQPSSRNRWIAGASAAGLVVGLGLGQLMNLPDGPAGPSAATVPQLQQVARGALPVADARVGPQPAAHLADGDELFFDDPELVPSQARVPDSLQYLNVITPSARDYDPR